MQNAHRHDRHTHPRTTHRHAHGPDPHHDHHDAHEAFHEAPDDLDDARERMAHLHAHTHEAIVHEHPEAHDALHYPGVAVGIFLTTLGLLIGGAWPARGEAPAGLEDEVGRLKARVEALEHRAPSGPLLPGLKVYGGLTVIGQGGANTPEQFGGNRGDATLSADLFVEAPVGRRGAFLLRLDVEQGAGLTRLPPLFTSPDGNTTGPNNDVETWVNPELVNLNEARYEHTLLGGGLVLTLGHIDLTGYFDGNVSANKETFQYIAQHFNNNIAIDWGGSVNFFGPGAVLTAMPTDRWTIRVGWFEGDGNHLEVFDRPFVAGQVAVKVQPGGREGNYRVYVWNRSTPHCRSAVDPVVFAHCDLVPAADQIMLKGNNAGAGVSLDQRLTDRAGAWARLGIQDGEVARFDRAASIGLVVSNALGRPHDQVGLGYGLVVPSNVYQTATGRSRPEQYAEVYYKYVVDGDGVASGFHLTPDLQVVVNPAGDGAVDPVFVYGLRAQANF